MLSVICTNFKHSFLNSLNPIKKELYYYKILDLTIHDPMIHDSCIIYPNGLKLCRDNHATGKVNFTEQKIELLLHLNTLLCDMTYNLALVFKLIDIYIYVN